MADTNTLESIINIIKSCDSVVLSTVNAQYTDARYITNMLNRNIRLLDLYFMTGSDTPKYDQLDLNPNCCLYYYNPETHYSVRLYGKMRFVDDTTLKNKYWMPEFKRFGYCGADDQRFIVMRFVPMEYKFYIGDEIKTGKIN